MSKRFIVGTVSIMAVVGTATTIILALSGYFASSIFSTNSRVDAIAKEVADKGERLSKVEEAVVTIKQDNRETREDIKNFLKELKKR